MTRYKVIVRSANERLPQQIAEDIQKGKADKVVAPADEQFIEDGPKILAIHKGCLLSGNV